MKSLELLCFLSLFKAPKSALEKSQSLTKSFYISTGSSVFRERSRTPNLQHQQQAALAEKFLKAIEEEREKEEEEEYRQQLRNLWNRYQTEEGNMEKELFDNGFEADDPLNNEIDRKWNRQVRDSSVLIMKHFNLNRKHLNRTTEILK